MAMPGDDHGRGGKRAVPSADDEEPSSSSVGAQPNKPSARRYGSCSGCMYYSRALQEAGRRPPCLGHWHYISPSEADNIRWPADKAKVRGSFKYVCLGYGVYTVGGGGGDPKKQGDLPVCTGIEIIVDQLEHTENSGQPVKSDDRSSARETPNDGASPPLREPSWVSRPWPSSSGSAKVDGLPDFETRLLKSAVLVATRMGQNLQAIVDGIQSIAYEIISPDKSRPK